MCCVYSLCVIFGVIYTNDNIQMFSDEVCEMIKNNLINYNKIAEMLEK